MGRIGPADSRDGTPFAGGHGADAGSGLCNHGALAGLDSSAFYRARNLPPSSPSAHGSQRHLSALLTSLHSQPENLAARLLYRFGSISRIAHASETELRQSCAADETWVDAFIGVRQLIRDGMRERVIRTRLGADRAALETYLLVTMQNLRDERILAIFADSGGFVIAEEILAEGAESHVLVTPRKIFGRALNLDARRIVLAHNHPSGCAYPSEHDIEHTRLLCRQAADLGLCIEDHFVVGSRKVFSMKDRRLM